MARGNCFILGMTSDNFHDFRSYRQRVNTKDPSFHDPSVLKSKHRTNHFKQVVHSATSCMSETPSTLHPSALPDVVRTLRGIDDYDASSVGNGITHTSFRTFLSFSQRPSRCSCPTAAMMNFPEEDTANPFMKPSSGTDATLGMHARYRRQILGTHSE